MPAPEEEAVNDDGPPKTELEQLQWKINSTTDEVGGSLLVNLVHPFTGLTFFYSNVFLLSSCYLLIPYSHLNLQGV